MKRIVRSLLPLLGGWLLSFLGWGLVAFIVTANSPGNATSRTWAEILSPPLRDWLPWAVVTPLIFRLVTLLPIDRNRWKLALPAHLACCVAVISLCHWWKAHVDPALGPSPGGGRGRGAPGPLSPRGNGPDGPPPGLRDFADRPPSPPDRGPPDNGSLRPPAPLEREGAPPAGRGPGGPARDRFFDLLNFASFELPIYLMLVSSAHAALFYRRSQERAASLARARLEALKMQLQPHFLFNTLNSIAELVHEAPDKADAMLTALSNLLRMSLETSGQLELPLRREMEFVQSYLDIMHTRFEERLRFEFDLAPDTTLALVPPFLLQPLVENAVQHGLQANPAGGMLTISAQRWGSKLRLTVADDGIGLPDVPREGIGLANTRARLAELYGDAAVLTLRNNASGVSVDITLPFHTVPDDHDPHDPRG